ncbi:MAG: adenylosuccinate synthase [Candidatus Brocadiia bacterium]|jgi:adenylosuccinate synthase|nr:adenylosuccinate synthase [Candidatus Brocadiia bacterium]
MMVENLLVLGLQWGDEGKGQIIDALSDRYEIIIRFQGGANAGHTVRVGDEKFVLHLIPSGILRPGKLCIIGNGLVVDPECLLDEIDALRERGIDVGPQNLAVSDRAHVVLPHHKIIDKLQDAALGERKIGTTGRGIGPCYADKAARRGLRLVEMMRPQTLRRRLEQLAAVKGRELTELYGADPIKVDELYAECSAHAERLWPFVCDTLPLVSEALRDGKPILLEGAQGTMLDVNFGTYPYVTSSNVTAGGAAVGTGIPPSRIDRVLGVVKAYCSRVGDGPFPTEQDNEIGQLLRKRGREYGSTTGRPRRCGWLDGVALRHAVAVNGADGIALIGMGVLSTFEKLKICVAYRVNGRQVSSLPSDGEDLAQAEPVYEEFEGWQTDLSGAKTIDQLPHAAGEFIKALERTAGVPVEMASVGWERRQIAGRTGNG